ncbi:MAG: signal peptidase I [Clostridia bacterium]|nr:signal peptidase I [Clostridia bacterium]
MSAPSIRPGVADVSRAVRRLHRKRTCLRLIAVLTAVLFIAAALLATVFRPVIHEGRAMLPALADGQTIFVNALARTPERGQLVLLERGDERLVRRVAALPGDTVTLTGGVLSVNGTVVSDAPAAADMPDTLTVPAQHYFVIADTPAEGLDSRSSQLGLVTAAEILGTVW